MNIRHVRKALKNFDWSIKSVLRFAAVIIILVIALAIVLAILGKVLRGATNLIGYDRADYGRGSSVSFVDDFVGEFEEIFEESARLGKSGFAVQSVSSDSIIAPEPPFFGDGGGDDAEEFERRSYNAHYETRNFNRMCDEVEALKPLEYVVFDNSNKSDDYCGYSFRVEVEHEEEILEKLKSLNPREFNININTLEESIEYHENELVVLQRRLDSISDTLTEAENAYDGLIRRATNQGDVSNLSTIINNKINTLDRLTQQQLNYQERIDRLARSKGDVENQVEYAHFFVSVSKTTFIDLEGIGDAWKRNVSDLFWKINQTILALTVGLIAFAFAALQFIVYATVVVLGLAILARLLWVGVRRIWQWEKGSS